MEEKLIGFVDGLKNIVIVAVVYIVGITLIAWLYWPGAQLFYWLDGV